MKGQYTIIGLMMTFVTLIAFYVLYPLLSSIIGNATAMMSDPIEIMLWRMSPLFIFLAILVSIWVYATANRESPQVYG